MQTRGPVQKAEITGIATFGDVDSIGTATFALFDLEAAQALFDREGSYTEILVGSRTVRESIAQALPADLQVETAEADDRSRSTA